MINRQFKNKKTFKELVKENREALLQDKQALERIEKRIEKRHEFLNKY
ncbi:FbpB family small basic protein [Priestia endophytica]|uniref:FbpB family small basic protein n=1 Tax=Priestia endophytica TaxID=135735 RepID=A0AAX1QAC9_9BACI|nr:FbpB family small basic protein [Priestia endophytica]RAS75594.1 FbpB family small basic protein [Priestia endophytica]RAS91150.1 FbpB family small basic protein [Priestia endophytica]